MVDEGAGHSGAILVGGVDDGSSSSLILAGKFSSFGGYDAVFGTNGVVGAATTAPDLIGWCSAQSRGNSFDQ